MVPGLQTGQTLPGAGGEQLDLGVSRSMRTRSGGSGGTESPSTAAAPLPKYPRIPERASGDHGKVAAGVAQYVRRVLGLKIRRRLP
jgi:hypothetical protein